MLDDAVWRLGAFFGALTLIVLWEIFSPRRLRKIPRKIRWSRNILLILIDNFLMRIFVPFTAAGVAIIASERGIGLFNITDIPLWASIVLSVLILDFLIYIQHVVFHAVPILWRLHQVHHIDQEIDVTTGIRFHPIEIFISTLIKCGVVLILGVPFWGVVVFEIILNVAAMFNHGNIQLPVSVDRWLRLLIVTPDMHRVHHSTIPNETHSNFGFNLPWWDRIFRTYRDQPELGHDNMTIGLPEHQDVAKTSLVEMLIIPFKSKKH